MRGHSNHRCGFPRRRRVHRGIGLIYGMLVILVLSAMASLAVDYARVQLVKNQLGAAADAAALAATRYAGTSVLAAQQAAVELAKANLADGKAVVIDPTLDVEFIDWDHATRTFEVLTGAGRTRANAVRVTAHRTAARGGAVDLPFGTFVGLKACDVSASAIAAIKESKVAAVGIDFVKMTGNSSQGSVMSNGDIILTGSAHIDGDAQPGPNHVVSGGSISGRTNSLTTLMSYPPPSAGNAATVNDNNLIPRLKSGSIVLTSQTSMVVPGGTYYLKNISLTGGSTLTFTGPATVYLTGSLTLTGHAVTSDDLPKNLKIYVVGKGPVSLTGSTALYADIYAPTSPVTITGTGDIYGSVIGKSITMTGNAQIHSDAKVKGTAKLVK